LDQKPVLTVLAPLEKPQMIARAPRDISLFCSLSA